MFRYSHDSNIYAYLMSRSQRTSIEFTIEFTLEEKLKINTKSIQI